MTRDDLLRASDQDRDAAVGALGDAYAAGRLLPEEFDRRVDVAFAAKTWGELDRVTEDLAAVSSSGGSAARPSPGTVDANRGRPALTWFVAVHAILVFLIVAMAGLAGRVTPAAVWLAYALVPLAVVLPTALGRRQIARHRRGAADGATRASASRPGLRSP